MTPLSTRLEKIDAEFDALLTSKDIVLLNGIKAFIHQKIKEEVAHAEQATKDELRAKLPKNKKHDSSMDKAATHEIFGWNEFREAVINLL